jgi:hypothetical protein
LNFTPTVSEPPRNGVPGTALALKIDAVVPLPLPPDALIAVTSLAVAELAAPPPDAVTLFVTLDGAFDATFTVTVIVS